MRYEVHGGRIATWALEAHVVDHCNLCCEQCCTLSPNLPEAFVDPAQLEQDLRKVARVLSPSVFKLTGGEPALHPNLADCIEAARASGISPQLSMTTNGLLAAQLPDRVFALLDRMTLSVYGSVRVGADALAAVERRCEKFGVRLNVKPIGIFQDMTPDQANDAAQALRAFATCWLKSRCHTVHGGRFYVCTRPPHLAAGLSARGLQVPDLSCDGVSIDQNPRWLLPRVLQLLQAEQPFESCRYCLGATGAWAAHRQGAGRRRTGQQA